MLKKFSVFLHGHVFVMYPRKKITMSVILRYPVEKTIALGGVATGNINAKEQAMVAVIIKYSGWIPVVRP